MPIDKCVARRQFYQKAYVTGSNFIRFATGEKTRMEKNLQVLSEVKKLVGGLTDPTAPVNAQIKKLLEKCATRILGSSPLFIIKQSNQTVIAWDLPKIIRVETRLAGKIIAIKKAIIENEQATIKKAMIKIQAQKAKLEKLEEDLSKSKEGSLIENKPSKKNQHGRNNRLKPTQLYKGPMAFDCLMRGKPEEEDDVLVPIDRIGNHRHLTTLEFAINFFNTIVETGREVYRTGKPIIIDIKARCPSKQEKRDKSGKIVSDDNGPVFEDLQCQSEISAKNLLETIGHFLNDKKQDLVGLTANKERFHKLQRVFNAKIDSLNRKSYMKHNNMSDCLVCVNPTKLGGMGKCISINYDSISIPDSASKVDPQNLFQCCTCKVIYCTKCKVVFGRDRIHDYRACSEVPKSDAKICPSCSVAIEKIEGCNKITCTCGAYFCYTCGADISGVGYNHFYDPTNNTNSKCLLFEGVVDPWDQFGEDVQFEENI